ncbi:MAG: UDP-N-acetylglucosamine 2-epimerase (non-hydrolyzing) [Planctomycetes bacterium]|nr:UDP-N-acetylglucosamine 2-epimerase (non-hydrolyzing) [Planctomycetota bacterium]
MTARLDVISVAGARPNFMKIAPLARALGAIEGVRHRIVHTGQHYDKNMSDLFFTELGIPEPWRNLGVGSSTHARQTAEIMVGFEELLDEDPCDVVCVVGDVNSTIACALVAVKRGIPVAHVEAGLRSFDRSMPEEVNRILTDAISDSLFVTEPSGMEHLAREGVDADRTFLVGNVMIDTLLGHRERARQSDVLTRVGVEEKGYGVVTLHRPSNVDDPQTLGGIMGALREISARLPLVFPVHPRTAERMAAAGFRARADGGFIACDPLGYIDFLRLMEGASLILTDSGGIQEEACILGVPCLTLRENTERPVTIEIGMNKLVGSDPEAIGREAAAILDGDVQPVAAPDLWDGRAAERIAETLMDRYGRAS